MSLRRGDLEALPIDDHEAAQLEVTNVSRRHREPTGAGDGGDVEGLLDRPGADEGALADVAPQLSVALHHRQRLAQLAARDAEHIAELAFGRKAGIGGQIALREVGAQLRQSSFSLIHAGSIVKGLAAEGALNRPISRQADTLTTAYIATDCG